jgi:hypothetical protein
VGAIIGKSNYSGEILNSYTYVTLNNNNASITSPTIKFANATDAANGVLTRNGEVANQTTSAKLTVTIKQLPYTNGDPREDIVLESTVYFYERLAKPGDYVFQDGTYSDELDDSKTPIGVCFYVDPDNKDNRLMVALENITQNETNIGQYKWGIGTGNTYTSNGELKYQGSPQLKNPENIGFDSMASIIDIPSIRNCDSHGGNPDVERMFIDSIYRTESTPDKFVSFDFSSCMGNIGFNTANTDIEVNYNKVVEAGKTYPIGYIYTMGMIQRRDEIMQHYKIFFR